MTCPGCGAPDDQGCRKGCPETQPQFQPTLEEAFKAGYLHGAGRAPWEDPESPKQLARTFRAWLREKRENSR